jgi:hypothetical protein
MRTNKWLWVFVRLAAIGILVAAQLCAQYTTASLGGNVVDATGAVVPGASVSAKNTDTGFTQASVSDNSGAFLFPRLPVGAYELHVGKPGFSAYVQSGITLVVDQTASVSVCGSRKLGNMISGDAWGCRDFPFSGFAWGSTAVCQERSAR